MTEGVREVVNLIERLTAKASALLPCASDRDATVLRAAIEAQYALLDMLASNQGE